MRIERWALALSVCCAALLAPARAQLQAAPSPSTPPAATPPVTPLVPPASPAPGVAPAVPSPAPQAPSATPAPAPSAAPVAPAPPAGGAAPPPGAPAPAPAPASPGPSPAPEQPPPQPPPSAVPAEPPPAPAATAPVPPPPPPSAPAHEPPPPRFAPNGALTAAARSRSWLGAGVAFGVLNLPKLGAGATLLGQIRASGLWPIDVSAVYWFDNDAELLPSDLDLQLHPLVIAPFPPGGSRASFRALEAKAAICPLEHTLRSGSIVGCAGIQGGVLFARPEGFMTEEDQTRPLFGFEAYARWHFQLWDPIGISYSAGVFVPLIRDRFGFRDGYGHFRELFKISPVGGRLDIALTYSL